jgi:hypothetical protein
MKLETVAILDIEKSSSLEFSVTLDEVLYDVKLCYNLYGERYYLSYNNNATGLLIWYLPIVESELGHINHLISGMTKEVLAYFPAQSIIAKVTNEGV